MRRLFVILTLLGQTLGAFAGVRFLSVDHPVVTDKNVDALEVRVAHSAARAGRNGLQQWSVGWGENVINVVFDFRNFVEGIDVPRVKIQCGNVTGTLDHGFDCDGGYNTLALEWSSDGSVEVLFGERGLHSVMMLDSLARPDGELLINARGGEIDVVDVVVEVNDDDISRLMTDYSARDIADAVKLHYLDRENDPKLSSPGGRYTLARIGDDLIYVDGAQINATHWHCGMLKGRLTPTPYVGYYHLLWYDSTGRRLSDDCYAEVDENSRTIKCVFPSLSATLRFSF